MKSLYNIVRCTAAMAALGFSMFATSCSNDEPALPTEPGEITFTAPAEIESASSRVSYTQIPGSIKVTWDPKDIVQLFPDENSETPIATFEVSKVDKDRNIATFHCIDVSDNQTLTNVKGTFRYVPTKGDGYTQTENGSDPKSDTDGSIKGTGHLKFANTIISNQIEGVNLTTTQPTLTFHNTTAIFRIKMTAPETIASETTLTIKGAAGWGNKGITLTFKPQDGNIVEANNTLIAYIAVPAGENQGVVKTMLGFILTPAGGKSKYHSYKFLNITYDIGSEYTADLTKANGTTAYQTYIDETGHEYVNLGLESNTMWATMNIGAKEYFGDNSYGDYFVWGHTNYLNEKTGKDDTGALPEFASKIDGVTNVGYNIPVGHDAASVCWKGNWLTPTYSQCKEMFDACNWRWSEDWMCYIGESKKNGALIFFPASGYYSENSTTTDPNGKGVYGDYWTATAATSGGNDAHCMHLSTNNTKVEESDDNLNLGCACPIRPVFVKQ